MNKHTPGPWRASGEDRVVSETLLYCGDVAPVIADGNGYRGDIATIQSANHLGGYAIGREEAAANARLIAAAPELLDKHEENLGDLWLLRRAIQAGDADRELLLRVADMERRSEVVIAKATQP